MAKSRKKDKRKPRKVKKVTPPLGEKIPLVSLAKKKLLAALGILSLFAFLIYGNTITHDYALDDLVVISGNSYTQKGLAGLGEIFTEDFFAGHHGKGNSMVVGGRYRPLSLVTFAVEYQFFGENPQISHFVNILLYALTAFLLFLVLFKLLDTKEKRLFGFGVPMLAALLFVAHPIHTEVVANIKGRDEILALLLSLLTFWQILRYYESRQSKYFILAGISFFFAMMSKENAITFLVIIPAGLYFFKGRSLKESARSLLPILPAAALFLLIRFLVLDAGNEALANDLMNNPFVEMNVGQKFATICYTLGLYLKLLLFPHPLTHDYYPYHIPIIEIIDLRAILSLAIYVALFGLFLKGLKSRSKWSFLILFYAATISVASNILFPIGVFMNERFAYMPSVAFVVALSYLLHDGVAKVSFFKEKAPQVLLGFMVIILGLYSFKTIDRNFAWKDNYTLFTTDVKTSANSAKVNEFAGRYTVGVAQKEQDPAKKKELYEQAIQYMEKAIEIYPKHGFALFNLAGTHYEYNKNYEGIIDVYKKVLAINPSNKEVFKNLETYFKDYNNVDYKLKAYTELAEASPKNHLAYQRKGRVQLLEKRNPAAAIPLLEKAKSLNPNDQLTQNSLGVAYYQSGQPDNALKNFLIAERLSPNNREVLTNIKAVYGQLGNQAKVVEYAGKLRN